MSDIRNKLKELIELIDEDEAPEEEVEVISGPPPEKIELEWDEIKEACVIRDKIILLNRAFSEFLLQHESRKTSVIKELESAGKLLESELAKMRKLKGVPAGQSYNIKFPEKEGEKGFYLLNETLLTSEEE